MAGALLPPDPAPELEVGEDVAPVLLGPPTPPATIPEVEVPLADVCDSCDDADAESEVDTDVDCPEVMLEAL